MAISETNNRQIANPILRGFNPDPSILRVGEDYYIATSTFQWFPGVQIHHSRDLKNWRLLTRPLRRLSQLDMRGNPHSGGIWAPCLSYHQGTFYLIYTDVKTLNGAYKDTHNYLVTTKDIEGEWSDPIYLNSSGFDPSLFHDTDGRKWLLNMIWDFRPRKDTGFGGILLQEYSEKEQRLIGPVKNIFKGSPLGITEGPHLYKRGEFYYLLTAEGGTFYDHAVTFARSRNLEGPYEIDPENPVLTSRGKPHLKLQRAGHGDIVETPGGETYLVHLCGRPVEGYCVLGRETSIQRMEWTPDGWLRKAGGGNDPDVNVPGPELPEHPWPALPRIDHFDQEELGIQYQTLRQPLSEEECSLKERKGFLRLRGRESLESCHDQVLVARRQEDFHFTASTMIEFDPASFQQTAGLIYYYSVRKFHYLYLTRDEEKGRVLEILSNHDGQFFQPLAEPVPVGEKGPVYLKLEGTDGVCRFSYSPEGKKWQPLEPQLDSKIISDEFGKELSFTGAFIGLCCQDLSGQRKHADFDFLEYYGR